MSNLVRAVPRGGLAKLDRQTARAVALIHADLFARRAEDAARRDLAAARIEDLALLTDRALAEGAAITRRLQAEIDGAPLAAAALSGIAEEGLTGIRRELRRFSLEG